MQSSKEPKVTEVETTNNHYSGYRNPRHWIMPAVVIILVLLLIGSIAHNRRRDEGFEMQGGKFGMMTGQRHVGAMGGPRRMNAGQNQIRGVVTAVNGSTITVAGNGATNDVETNSSTQYQNGSSVKVNDSVAVFGNISGGKFTATEIVIN